MKEVLFLMKPCIRLAVGLLIGVASIRTFIQFDSDAMSTSHRRLSTAETQSKTESDDEAARYAARYDSSIFQDEEADKWFTNQLNDRSNLRANADQRQTIEIGSNTDLFVPKKTCPDSLTPPPLPGKKGIGFTLKDWNWSAHLRKVRELQVSWNYSWGPTRHESQPSDIEFIPMIWGAWGEQGIYKKLVDDIFPEVMRNRVHRYLAFNEPDHQKQANLAVDDVVRYWAILQRVLIPLASPSVAHAFGDWMQDFMQRSEDDCLRMEYTALHWYGSPSPNKFKSDMLEAYELYGRRPLLITEFAPADWQADTPAENKHSEASILAFMKEVIPWLEQEDKVAGYAWFPFNRSMAAGSTSALYNGDTSDELTSLGYFYSTVTQSNPMGDQSISVENWYNHGTPLQ